MLKIRSITAIAICCFILSCNHNSKLKDTTDSDSPKLSGQKTRTSRLNIDILKASPANCKLLLENKYVRVLEYNLKSGEKDSPHTHPPKSSYVVSGGRLKVYLENGETLIANEETGTASWRDYVGRHYVENIGNTTVTIILTEIKSPE